MKIVEFNTIKIQHIDINTMKAWEVFCKYINNSPIYTKEKQDYVSEFYIRRHLVKFGHKTGKAFLSACDSMGVVKYIGNGDYIVLKHFKRKDMLNNIQNQYKLAYYLDYPI